MFQHSKKLKKISANVLVSILATVTTVTFYKTENATAESPESITLSGTVRDFKATHPNFGFGYMFGTDQNLVGRQLTEAEPGVWVTKESGKNLVTEVLGINKKPIFNPNSGIGTVTNAEDFNQWYNNTLGINLSKPLSLTLNKNANGMYHYSSDAFFPINNQLYGNVVNDPGLINPPTPLNSIAYELWENSGYKNRNYFFTYETHSRFVYKGNEVFTFSGDDDVWVYINGKRVIDLSGVHGNESETFVLDSAMASQLGLTIGQAYDFDFFFAERNYSGSNFTITTNIELNNAPIANNDTASTMTLSSKVIDVLSNDTDPDGDNKFITNVSAANGSNDRGTIAIENNKLVYSAGSIPGEYIYNYIVEDEHGDMATGTLVITVTAFAD